MWVGRQSPTKLRKKALELAKAHFDSDCKPAVFQHMPTRTSVARQSGRLRKNSLGRQSKHNLNGSMRKTSKDVKPTSRPSWALFARVIEGGESILLREKFSDWPEQGRIIKMKGHEASVKLMVVSGRRGGVGGGVEWEEGWSGRRGGVGGGVEWEEGWSGRRGGVGGGVEWEEGWSGRRGGVGGGVEWEEGWSGRRGGVGGGVEWEEGWSGRRGGVGGGVEWEEGWSGRRGGVGGGVEWEEGWSGRRGGVGGGVEWEEGWSGRRGGVGGGVEWAKRGRQQNCEQYMCGVGMCGWACVGGHVWVGMCGVGMCGWMLGIMDMCWQMSLHAADECVHVCPFIPLQPTPLAEYTYALSYPSSQLL